MLSDGNSAPDLNLLLRIGLIQLQYRQSYPLGGGQFFFALRQYLYFQPGDHIYRRALLRPSPFHHCRPGAQISSGASAGLLSYVGISGDSINRFPRRQPDFRRGFHRHQSRALPPDNFHRHVCRRRLRPAPVNLWPGDRRHSLRPEPVHLCIDDFLRGQLSHCAAAQSRPIHFPPHSPDPKHRSGKYVI